MKDWATGLAVGALIAVILAGGGAVGALELGTPSRRRPPKPHAPAFARIGPTARIEPTTATTSARHQPAATDMAFIGVHRVQRPSMMTTDMPERLLHGDTRKRQRRARGASRLGGWQECQAVLRQARRERRRPRRSLP